MTSYCSHFFKNIEGSEYVYLYIMLRIFDRFSDINLRSKMKNYIRMKRLKDISHTLSIPYIPFTYEESSVIFVLFYVESRSGRKVIQNTHLISPIHANICKVWTDKPSSTCDKDFHTIH